MKFHKILVLLLSIATTFNFVDCKTKPVKEVLPDWALTPESRKKHVMAVKEEIGEIAATVAIGIRKASPDFSACEVARSIGQVLKESLCDPSDVEAVGNFVKFLSGVAQGLTEKRWRFDSTIYPTMEAAFGAFRVVGQVLVRFCLDHDYALAAAVNSAKMVVFSLRTFHELNELGVLMPPIAKVIDTMKPGLLRRDSTMNGLMPTTLHEIFHLVDEQIVDIQIPLEHVPEGMEVPESDHCEKETGIYTAYDESGVGLLAAMQNLNLVSIPKAYHNAESLMRVMINIYAAIKRPSVDSLPVSSSDSEA